MLAWTSATDLVDMEAGAAGGEKYAWMIFAAAPALVIVVLALVCGPRKVFSAMTAMATEYNRAYTTDSDDYDSDDDDNQQQKDTRKRS